MNKRLSNILSNLINRYMYSMGMIVYAFDPNDDADKAILKNAVDEAVSALSAKNKELLGELKSARKNSEIKPEQLEALEAQIDTLKGELTTAQRAVKEATVKAEQATKQLEAESGFTQKLLVDNGLSDVLVKAGVSNPAMLKAVKSMLAGQVQIVAEGDNRIAKVGDKALADYVSDWAKSDEGKHFISAPNNSGGGASGGTSTQSGTKTMTRAQFDAADANAKVEFSKAGGKITD